MGWCFKILDRVFAVLGALLFSQAPLFIYYYVQQLQGRVAELQSQRDALVRVARQSGKTLEQYIQKFLSSTDSDFNAQGHLLQGMIDRLDVLTKGLVSLQNATVWEKPFLFFKFFHLDIAQSTWANYALGLPLSLEGGVYALAGIGVGYAIFYTIKQVLQGLWSLLIPCRAPVN